MGFRTKTGWTLIEMTIVFVVIAILSVVGVQLVSDFLRHSIYTTRRLAADTAAAEAMEIIVDGDARAKGLRFCKEIRQMIHNGTYDGVEFINQDGVRVMYVIFEDYLTRMIDEGGGWSEAEFIPYYQYPQINISGQDGQLLTYYDSNENVTAVSEDVRRIDIKLEAWTGSGDFDRWEAQCRLDSSVAVSPLGP